MRDIILLIVGKAIRMQVRMRCWASDCPCGFAYDVSLYQGHSKQPCQIFVPLSSCH